MQVTNRNRIDRPLWMIGRLLLGAACKETSVGSGVFEREWTGASVQWDCATGHGKITRK